MAASNSAIRPRRFFREVNGILLLDKTLGLSSNAALQEARALYGALKAGHAGSLDPLASGLLPVCFGQATKVCGRLLHSGKTYRVLARLGARTASGDCETEVVERVSIPALTETTVDAVLHSFLGIQQQIPPMHSALKHEGKRLYEFARRGEDVERPPRQIEIHRIQRVSWGADHIEFDVRCSKGTYIRTLAADIAIRLGTLAFVEGLRRLAVDPFDGLPMFTLDELTSLQMPERDLRLHPPDAAFSDLPALVLDDVQERALLQGRSLLGPEPAGTAGQLRVYGADQRFLGLVDVQIDGRLQPSRLFVDTGPSKA